MPLDRWGAQVASQQSLILRNGKAKNTLVSTALQGIAKRPQRDADGPITQTLNAT
jgi:hypothetical protein